METRCGVVSLVYTCTCIVILHVLRAIYNQTSAFGTYIQKYVLERYVCLIVFMVIAQTHVQAVATVH